MANEASPLAFVVTRFWPTKVWPSMSPFFALAKTSIRYWRFDRLLSAPLIVVFFFFAGVFAAVSTGKFCRLLPPSSASPGSLAVGPSSLRSMPNPPLAKMLLRETWFPVPNENWPPMATPASPLNAIALARIRLSFASETASMPRSPLPSGCVPVRSVPIRLPWMVLSFDSSSMPS
jgi:hypothetical protein